MKTLIGTGVALVTPFDTNGTIDTEALRRVVTYQIDNGIDYLVVLGTTAENATLSDAEKQLIIDTVISVNKGRLPLVLGIGGNHTKAVVDRFKQTDLSAFAAVLSVSPYYNKPTQQGIYEHYKAISEVSEKPIIIYNVPGRTASNVLPETIVRLAGDFKNIIGIKEAKGDMVQAMQMIADTPDDFLVISGDDMLALPITLAGGTGVISVIGQGFPKEFSEMIKLALNNDAKNAYSIHYKLAPAIDIIFEEGNPAGIKTVFKELGICQAQVRLPLVQASEELGERIKKFVTNLS